MNTVLSNLCDLTARDKPNQGKTYGTFQYTTPK